MYLWIWDYIFFYSTAFVFVETKCGMQGEISYVKVPRQFIDLNIYLLQKIVLPYGNQTFLYDQMKTLTQLNSLI